MKRILFGGLLALGLVATAAPAWADCYFECNVSRHMTFVRTCRNRCWSFNSYVNPLPCVYSHGYGYTGYAPAAAPLAYAPYGYAPAAAPAAPASPAAQPPFRAPQPRPTTNNPTGLQQAGYSYYGQTMNAGYGYDAGYNYGAGYGYGYYGYGAGYSYAQAPNYWY